MTNILTRLFRAKSGAPAKLPTVTAAPNTDGYGVLSVIRPGAQAAVVRCIQLISDTVAAMPLLHQRLNGKIFAPVGNSELSVLLNIEPNSTATAVDFWRAVMAAMLSDGVAYIYPQWADGKLQSLTHVLKSEVKYDPQTRSYTIASTYNGIDTTVSERGIIVLRYAPKLDASKGLKGREIDSAKGVIKLAQSAEQETQKRVDNGGAQRLIVNVGSGTQSGIYSPKEGELDDYAMRLHELIRGGTTCVAGRAGVSITPVGSSSADLQLQAVREFAVRDICRFFGVPPTFVYSDGASNYKSTEMAYVDFYASTINPMLRSIEAELSRKLIPRSMWQVQRIRYDRSARMTADLDTQAKYFAQMLANGALTPNEIRAKLGLAPCDGGDMLQISANLKPINDYGQK